MQRLLLDISFLFLLVLANGLFALAEVALLTAPKPRLRQAARRGHAGAARALRLAESPEEFLATVQVGITLVGIVSGVFGGARIAGEIAPWIGRIEPLAPHREGLAVALVVGLVTYLSLVVGELVPKQLAMRHAEAIAIAAAAPMQLLSRAATPLVRFLGLSSRLVLGLFGRAEVRTAAVSEEELRLLIQEGTQAGLFARGEHHLLERSLRLGGRRVTTLMVPRNEVVWLDLAASPEENRRRVESAPHHHFPVCRGSLDRVEGTISLRQLWLGADRGLADLAASMRPPVFVPETATGLRLLESLRGREAHAALVVDEYGDIVGFVTLNEVSQALLGELAPAESPGEALATRRSDGSWLLDGSLSLAEGRDLLGLSEPPVDRDEGVRTLGGLVMHLAGRVPELGFRCEWEGIEIEVVDMDGQRVDRLLARPR